MNVIVVHSPFLFTISNNQMIRDKSCMCTVHTVIQNRPIHWIGNKHFKSIWKYPLCIFIVCIWWWNEFQQRLEINNGKSEIIRHIKIKHFWLGPWEILLLMWHWLCDQTLAYIYIPSLLILTFHKLFIHICDE